MLYKRAQIGVYLADALTESLISLHALLVLYMERHYHGTGDTGAVLQFEVAIPRTHISHEHVRVGVSALVLL